MVSLIITITASLILVAGIVINQNRIPQDLIPAHVEPKVLSGEDTKQREGEVQENLDNNTNDNVASVALQVTSSPSQVSNETAVSESVLNNFIYSRSEIVTRTESSLELISTDSTELITNWYKERLRSMDFNVNSFVTTNTNNNVNNRLVSSNSSHQIEVVIEKLEDQKDVTILISLE